MASSAPMDLDTVEDVFLNDSLGPTIAEHARKCSQLFHKHMSTPDIVPDLTMMEDQLARFTLWASNMDVFGPLNVSMDFRLRYSPTIVGIIHQLLDVIYSALTALKPIIDTSPSPNRKKRRISMSHQARLIKEDDDSSDTDSDEDQVEKNTSLLTFTIGGTVTRLFRLSNAIRKSAKASRTQKIKDYQVDPEAKLAIDELRLYTECYVRFRFPEAHEFLRLALVEANALRLRRLFYQRSHRRRVALTIEQPQVGLMNYVLSRVPEKPSTVRFASEMVPKIEIRKKETCRQDYPPAPLTYATTAQQTEVRALYASSTTEVPRAKSVLVNNELSFPPIPQTGECPYCGVIIEFKGYNKSKDWRTHVLRDLEPFICLRKACTDPSRQEFGSLTFDTSKAWIDHMRNSHGHVWECRAPSHEPIIFEQELNFQKHSCNEHGIPEAQVRVLSEAARRPMQQKIQECPFGDDFAAPEKVEPHSVFSSDALCTHVAGHLKEIALLALQKLPSDSKDEASDVPSDISLAGDGVAKFRGSMHSVLDDDELDYSDVAENDQATVLEDGITSSVHNLDLQDNEAKKMHQLDLAIYSGDLELVQLLMENGVSPSSGGYRGRTPLHYASLYGKVDIMKLLLRSSDYAAMCLKDDSGQTPLHYAAKKSFIKGIDLMVEAGVSIDIPDNYGLTPLLWAVAAGQRDAVEELLSRGANINYRSGGTSALDWAVRLGHSHLFKLLMNRPEMSQSQWSDVSLLNQAAARRSEPVVYTLVKAGVSPNRRDRDGWSAIHWAAEGMRSVIDHGETEHRDVQQERMSLINLLIQCGADVNAVSSYGTSPLHCAAGVGRSGIDFLLRHGADPTSTTCHGWTAMHHVAYIGDDSSIDRLNDHEYSLDQRRKMLLSRDNHGWSALHLAVLGRHLGTIRELLRLPLAFELINQRDDGGLTAEDWLYLEPDSHSYRKICCLAYSKSRCCRPVFGLRQAAKENNVDMIELLIEQGHNVNGMDLGERTALYYAAKNGHMPILNILLKNGANPNILPEGLKMWELFISDAIILQQFRRYGYVKPVHDAEKDEQIKFIIQEAALRHLTCRDGLGSPENPDEPSQNASSSSQLDSQVGSAIGLQPPLSRMSGLWKRLRGQRSFSRTIN